MTGCEGGGTLAEGGALIGLLMGAYVVAAQERRCGGLARARVPSAGTSHE
jgi:hypothetical protein